MRKLLFTLCLLLPLTGCNREEKNVSGLQQKIRAEIDEAISTPAPPGAMATPAATTALVIAPSPVVADPVAPLVANASEGDDSIDIQVLEKRFDSTRVYFTVLYRNVSKQAIRTRIFVFGYDSNNRLVHSYNKTYYFQPREQMLEDYNFTISSGMTRWIITVR